MGRIAGPFKIVGDNENTILLHIVEGPPWPPGQYSIDFILIDCEGDIVSTHTGTVGGFPYNFHRICQYVSEEVT